MSNLELNASESLSIQACRACLDTKVVNYVQINSENGLWAKLYEFCTGLPVRPDSGSQLLCPKCAKVIKCYSEFKNQCHKSEDFWCSLVADDKCSNIINVKNEGSNPIEESNNLDYTIFTEGGKIENDEIDMVKEENYFSDQHFEELEECSLDGGVTEIHSSSKSIKKHHKDVCKWKCDKCKRKYKSKTWLKNHLKTCQGSVKKNNPIHKKENIINEVVFCGICDFESDINLMRQHLDIHALSNDLSCANCDFIGKDFASMVSHRYSHQPYSRPKLFCHLCDGKFGSSTSLQFHYRTVHLNQSGLDCTLCSKKFRTYKTWRNHEKWHRVDRYICDICGKKFLFRHAIEAHLIDHSDFDKYICDSCGRGFKRRFNLECHVNRRHVTHKPVQCSHCNKTFKSADTLQTHMRLVSKEKLFDCPVCPKKFPSEVTMKNHLFWHTDERPFNCEICGSKYKAKSQLKVHMRQHTGILPFKCQNCDKGFASSTQLKIHTSVHTGIRRHKCGFCPRTFHSRKLVQSHCAAHHKDSETKLGITI